MLEECFHAFVMILEECSHAFCSVTLKSLLLHCHFEEWPQYWGNCALTVLCSFAPLGLSLCSVLLPPWVKG